MLSHAKEREINNLIKQIGNDIEVINNPFNITNKVC